MSRSLLLISTSAVHGTPYLEHAFGELRDFLGETRRVLFIPHALKDHEGYARKARAAFESIGYGLDSLHEAPSRKQAVEQAEAVFTGGGNTFRLLAALHRFELIGLLRRRVGEGMRYAGASAGLEPPSFEALGLVPFQINPHYLDPDPRSTHMGETRETRIREFHEENETPVVGLREGAMLRVEGERVTLKGLAGARIFRRGQDPVEVSPVAALEPLLGS